MRLIFVSLLYLAIYILCLRLPVISIIKYSTSIAYESIFVACIATIFSFTLTSSLIHFTFHFERSEKQPRQKRSCQIPEIPGLFYFFAFAAFLAFLSSLLSSQPNLYIANAPRSDAMMVTKISVPTPMVEAKIRVITPIIIGKMDIFQCFEK